MKRLSSVLISSQTIAITFIESIMNIAMISDRTRREQVPIKKRDRGDDDHTDHMMLSLSSRPHFCSIPK